MSYGRREFFDPILQQVFLPDYAITACRLFQKMAIWSLVFDNDLDIYWSFLHKLPSTCSAPSWVPDFAKRHEPLQEDVRPLELARRLTTAAAICNGVLTLHARSLACIQEIFQVDEPEWLNEAACLWRLDNYSAQLCTGEASVMADLAVHLPQLCQELRISH
ncbi:hypothetical protein QBC44DRAFT_364162 [Cladorrhinum sp. PSN332]|nr:hypothetical protein QBC44DRAFT_364162 [Cladorrhinum sp. PSN332]